MTAQVCDNVTGVTVIVAVPEFLRGDLDLRSLAVRDGRHLRVRTLRRITVTR